MRQLHARAASAATPCPAAASPAAPELPAPLTPDKLPLASLEAVGELLEQGQSPNTRASYRSAMAYWDGWYALRYRQALTYPVPVAAVTQFVVDHLQRSSFGRLAHELPPALDQALVASGHKGKLGPLAVSTVCHRISVLSRAHQQRRLPNPCRDPAVRELLARARRASVRRGAVAQRPDPLEHSALDALLATCGQTLRDKRDRALLLFAWASGGRRRSEVAGADMRWLTELGPEEYQYELRCSKTNQAGAALPENRKPIVGQAARALREWLQAGGVRSGAIFRSVRKGGAVGGALSAAAVREIVRRRCALAGIAGHYSAHSIRSGFVTEASCAGMPLAEIMGLSGHRSVQAMSGYCRPIGASGQLRQLLGTGRG